MARFRLRRLLLMVLLGFVCVTVVAPSAFARPRSGGGTVVVIPPADDPVYPPGGISD